MSSNQMSATKTYIYRSENKADHYLYLSKALDSATSKLPSELLALLGDLSLVMEIEISLETKLIAAKPESVINALEHQGYYLQVPPSGFVHPLDQHEVVLTNTDKKLPN